MIDKIKDLIILSSEKEVNAWNDTVYINKDNVEDLAEEIVKLLNIPIVSLSDSPERRELLIAFLEDYLSDRIDIDITMIENDVDKYLSN